MNKIEAIIRPERLDAVKEALAAAGFVGLNIVASPDVACRRASSTPAAAAKSTESTCCRRPRSSWWSRTPRRKRSSARSSKLPAPASIGDGKIFVSPVAQAIRVRTGERGDAAL